MGDHIVMARHGFLLLALALLLGVCLGSAVRAEPVGDAASSTQSESTSAEEKEADVKSSSEAASNSQEQAPSEDAEAAEKQPDAESKQSSQAASASAASQQSAETADSSSEQSEGQPSASESASEEKTDEASASAASESASEEKTEKASASSDDQAQSQDKPATEGSSEPSDEKTDASRDKEDSDSSSSKEEESTKKKAAAGATKLALGKTALPIAHPNGMPASIVNTAFGPTLGNAAYLNGKKYGIVGEGLNAHAVPMTDTFPSANGRVTINPVNPKLQQIAPAPVMGSGIGATPCSGAACSGMTTVPVGQKIVHDMTVTNVPGVPQAEVAVAAPGTPTMRQGK